MGRRWTFQAQKRGGVGSRGRWGEISILEALSKGCGLDPEGHGESVAGLSRPDGEAGHAF